MDGEVVTMVRNFRKGDSWESVILNFSDVQKIQRKIRELNKGILEESLRDATNLLASYAGPYESRTGRLTQLAMFLASKRIVDIRTTYEEFLRSKIWRARDGRENRSDPETEGGVESPSFATGVQEAV